MSNNIIDKIQLSGITYDIGGQGGSGVSVVEVTQAEYDALPTSAKTDTSKMYVITDAEAGDLTNYYTKTETNTLLGDKADTATTYTKTEVDNAITAATSTKQDTLVSGTNIKTINNTSILGSGNIDIQGGGKAIEAGTNISVTTGETANTINCTLPITANTAYNKYMFGDALTADSYSILIGSNAVGKWSNYSVAIIPKNATNDKVTYQSQGGVLLGASTVITGLTSDGGPYSVAIGYGSRVTGSSSVAISQNASVSGNTSIAIGRIANVKGNSSVAIGNSSKTSGDSSVAIGSGATANGVDYKMNLNNQIKVTPTNQVYIYNKDNTEMICLQDNLGGGGSSYTAGDGIDITNDVISVTGKVDTSAFTAHTADTVIHVTSAEKSTWNAKSDFSGDYNDLTNKLSAGTNITIVDNVISAEGGGSITIDPSLDSGSTNAVANSAITTAIDSKANITAAVGGYQFGTTSNVENIKFKAVGTGYIGSAIYYPNINGKAILTNNLTWAKNNYNFQLVETSAITTAITSSSTDAQVPSAKAVYDIVGDIETLLSQI